MSEQKPQTKFIVEGYAFSTKEEAEKAARELAKIKVLDAKVDFSQLTTLKALYVRAVDSSTFETPIGLGYLRNMQMHLIREEQLGPDEKPIPIKYSRFTQEREILQIKEEYEEAHSEEEAAMNLKIRTATEQMVKAQQKSRTLTFACAVLIVMVIGMFAITKTGKNENILNYKTAITNQYSQWEQELTDREKAVREKETELGIEYEP